MFRVAKDLEKARLVKATAETVDAGIKATLRSEAADKGISLDTKPRLAGNGNGKDTSNVLQILHILFSVLWSQYHINPLSLSEHLDRAGIAQEITEGIYEQFEAYLDKHHPKWDDAIVEDDDDDDEAEEDKPMAGRRHPAPHELPQM